MRSAWPVPFLALIAVQAGAQTFPEHPTQGWVVDEANLLPPDAQNRINVVSRDFNADTGAPIAVVTVPSLASVGAQNMTVEEYGRALFDRWRIGHRNANGGILLLVAKDDRKDSVVLGRDWQHDYDARAHEINASTVLPAFRQGDYAGGIVRGVEALAHLADSGNGSGQAQEPPPVDGVAGSTGPGLGSLCCPLLAVGGVLLLVGRARRARRFGPGYGPQPGPYVDGPADDGSGFLAGMMMGEMMSGPMIDPGPMVDPGYDPGPDDGGFDPGGGFDSGGSFDSGDSGGGGDSGGW